MSTSPLRLRLPATSANLGPGFDTLAVALDLYLSIDARLAGDQRSGSGLEGFSIEASGRDAAICSRVEGNLLLSVYRDTVFRFAGRQAPALALTMQNDIPLGMGCGSSAASRLAALALASHFGGMGWERARILDEAARLEGHPDNVASCWLGGFVAAGFGVDEDGGDGAETELGDSGPVARPVIAVSMPPPVGWRALLVIPELPLATQASRAVLPTEYSRAAVIRNLQRVAVLTAAVAAGRGELLATATRDCLHQPYRSAVCQLLPLLLPLAGQAGILSVTLSGAGPAVLLLVEAGCELSEISRMVRERVSGSNEAAVAELILCRLAADAAAVEAG